MKRKLKALLLSVAATTLLSVAIVPMASADTGTAHIKLGSISGGASSIPYWYDSTVSTYGYSGAVDNARARWSGISSKIGWQSSTSTNAKMKVYAGKYALPAGTYGQTAYFLTSGRGVDARDITGGSSYDVATVTLDIGWTGSWQQSERFMNAGHEVGHVLGMNHFETSPAHSGSHWMKSGQYALEQPTAIDIAHMRTKWGY